MTHKDIYTKFMIEYDKANVTSSYPSLTEYEVATVLDKAYNALIAQKVTGNNVRRVALEGDLKSIADLTPLMKTENINISKIEDTNMLKSILPNDYLYYVSANMLYNHTKFESKTVGNPPHVEKGYYPVAYDEISHRKMPVKLVNHQIAEGFIASSYNIPWVKIPVCYIENDTLYTVYDSFKIPELGDSKMSVTYIKTPNKFVKDLEDLGDLISNNYKGEPFPGVSVARNQIDSISYFDYKLLTAGEEGYYKQPNDAAENALSNLYTFECNDTMAEELISLAIAFALENVESQRLNSKLNMRGLEA